MLAHANKSFSIHLTIPIVPVDACVWKEKPKDINSAQKALIGHGHQRAGWAGGYTRKCGIKRKSDSELYLQYYALFEVEACNTLPNFR
jgi:hypothetical protein